MNDSEEIGQNHPLLYMLSKVITGLGFVMVIGGTIYYFISTGISLMVAIPVISGGVTMIVAGLLSIVFIDMETNQRVIIALLKKKQTGE